mmetsp:Transcript_6677/g.16188  ORF Transcript_6677/g.16188 Transcript_6677/m.16188 type:complete len:210 (+) Transcript_6677:2826-3455(+)
MRALVVLVFNDVKLQEFPIAILPFFVFAANKQRSLREADVIPFLQEVDPESDFLGPVHQLAALDHSHALELVHAAKLLDGLEPVDEFLALGVRHKVIRAGIRGLDDELCDAVDKRGIARPKKLDGCLGVRGSGVVRVAALEVPLVASASANRAHVSFFVGFLLAALAKDRVFEEESFVFLSACSKHFDDGKEGNELEPFALDYWAMRRV